jgi:hypothetical protein
MPGESIITIPADLILLVRSGAYGDLHASLGELRGVIEACRNVGTVGQRCSSGFWPPPACGSARPSRSSGGIYSSMAPRRTSRSAGRSSRAAWVLPRAATVVGQSRWTTRSWWRSGSAAGKRSGEGRKIPVFAAGNGSPLMPSNVFRRVLQPAREEACLPWVGFHAFRHTCASMLFAQDRNVVQVQRWLGHHSAAFTLATYVHLLDGDIGQPLALGSAEAASHVQTFRVVGACVEG